MPWATALPLSPVYRRRRSPHILCELPAAVPPAFLPHGRESVRDAAPEPPPAAAPAARPDPGDVPPSAGAKQTAAEWRPDFRAPPPEPAVRCPAPAADCRCPTGRRALPSVRRCRPAPADIPPAVRGGLPPETPRAPEDTPPPQTISELEDRHRCRRSHWPAAERCLKAGSVPAPSLPARRKEQKTAASTAADALPRQRRSPPSPRQPPASPSSRPESGMPAKTPPRHTRLPAAPQPHTAPAEGELLPDGPSPDRADNP